MAQAKRAHLSPADDFHFCDISLGTPNVAEGPMAALIRSHDWSTTSIGVAEAWSPALRMMVQFLLANRFPMLLWWGPDYVSIYNDAYRPILGLKHPKALGQPVRECWREIWDVLRPLIDAPFHGGPSTWMEDIQLEVNRHGFFEETHFTVAYSPVPDETTRSGVGGVLATVHEISEKVVGERRVVVLRDLGRLIDFKTAVEACRVSAAVLGQHARDVPFGLVYLIEADRQRARLAGSTGVAATACPQVIMLKGQAEDQPWPIAEMMRTETMQIVEHLTRGIRDAAPGPWSEPPRMAAILPIRTNVAHQLAGILVLGISARLPFDDSYRDFFALVTTQIATAIASARAHEEERRRAEALASIEHAKTAFFSNVSHEFRTPLTLILGPLEDALASHHGILPAEVATSLTASHRNALRLLKLVNTLLDFCRIENGRVQASYRPTDVAALTAELASNFRSLCEKAGLRLIVKCRPGGLEDFAYVDRDMWEKIVLNLVSNAFKFTLKGEIEICLEMANGHFSLTVRDTGIGIPDEEIPNLFERFHRIERTHGRTHEGTGIGLALVQELVKLHGGTITVSSRLGVGSRFTVAIPLGKAHLDPDRVGTALTPTSTAVTCAPFVEEAFRWLPDEMTADDPGRPQEKNRASPIGQWPEMTNRQREKPRILWADDNADMRAYVSRLLGERFAVNAVSNGKEALDAARSHPPDLVLSDVMMPELDGIGLLRALRSDPSLGEIPVILLSARAGEGSRVGGVEAGADDYVVKPFSARELVARIDTHIRMSRIRQEAKAAAQSRLLLEHVLAAQEEERQRIARELHDEAGQLLTSLLMTLKVLEDSTSRLSVKKIAREVRSTARHALDELRRLAHGLHPAALAELGLPAAVRAYLAAYEKPHHVRTRFIEDGVDSKELPANVQIAVYRVIQEALTNVAKHSHAKAVTVSMIQTSDELEVSVVDDGCGFDASRLDKFSNGHLGLRSIRERSALLGGVASVKSGTSGTQIIVRIPVPVAKSLATASLS